ncbi:hypothetical protein EDB19DRAFT_1716022 [Suillus lakei]|nr:hypothetical protein EDB19DRAFT_1716022 [Suillus lakei]
MSSEQERQTVLIPLNLGSPSQYDRSIFPLMRMKHRDILDQVNIVLEATLDELFKMRDMAGNLTELETVFVNAKEEYDRLKSEKNELENQKTSPFNLPKLVSRYRSLRLLGAAARGLYRRTRSSSEELRRQLLSVNGQDLQRVDYDDVPSDACISAIAVPLESQLDESTASFFTEAANFIASQVNLLPDGNPFGDDQRVEESANTEYDTTFDSRISDGKVASPPGSRLSGASSGQGSGNNFFVFNNGYVASRSAIQSPALNRGGSHTQGSSPRH